MQFPKLISVKTIEKYKIHVQFNDGTEGIYDVSDLAGKGAFKSWDIDNKFFKVFINPETNVIAWDEMLEIDTLNCYLQIKGITFEEYKKISNQNKHAFS
ncbi:MAG: DUF2442 domain-containing protein [Chitinophagaceae bacterium]